MRTTKELLQLVHDELLNNKLGFSGLCGVVSWLYSQEKITDQEESLLNAYLNKHQPITWYLILNLGTEVYWWPQGKTKPRLKWLKRHIKKQK